MGMEGLNAEQFSLCCNICLEMSSVIPPTTDHILRSDAQVWIPAFTLQLNGWIAK